MPISHLKRLLKPLPPCRPLWILTSNNRSTQPRQRIRHRSVRNRAVSHGTNAQNTQKRLGLIFSVGKIMNMFHFYWPFIYEFVPTWNCSVSLMEIIIYPQRNRRNSGWYCIWSICILIVSPWSFSLGIVYLMESFCRGNIVGYLPQGQMMLFRFYIMIYI